jgi:hypothetical protein
MHFPLSIFAELHAAFVTTCPSPTPGMIVRVNGYGAATGHTWCAPRPAARIAVPPDWQRAAGFVLTLRSAIASPPLMPAQAGIQNWVPAFAGTSGSNGHARSPVFFAAPGTPYFHPR